MTTALDLLARTEKWYISAGEGLLWAPPFPVWLDRPGFWDAAHLFEYPLQPLFTVALVDEVGREIPLRAVRRRWTPAALEVSYAAGSGLEVVESRMVLPGFVVGSEWQIANVGLTRTPVHAVAWTTAPGEEVAPDDVAFSESELSWHRALKGPRDRALTVRLSLAMARGADSWGVVRSDRTADHPHFDLSPFWDRWDPLRGGLQNAAELGDAGESEGGEGDAAPRGLVYLGVHRAIDIEPGASARLAVALRVVPDAGAAAVDAEPPVPRRSASFLAASRASWEDFFDALPTFRCSDPYFERYWAYRWYGLRLNAIAAGWGNYGAPTVAAGVAEFHQPIASSAPCHVRELRWAKDPEWARGVVRTFVHHQLSDGSFPERVGALQCDAEGRAPADWGGAILALDAVHPSDAFLREVFPALERYADWTASADAEHAGQVDAAVFDYQLCRALERLGPRGGIDPARWRARADSTGAALLKRMWDPKAGVFADVNPVTGRRASARRVRAFYPYATDLVGAPHLASLVTNMFDPRQFWKPFPVSSASGKDPLYDPDGASQGRRVERPCNGRVWPIANSHVAEAIARVAIHHLPALRAHLAEFVTKYVRMMFWEGDASRPNSFEHYHPVSGRPSAYRGLDDHLQSWVNDLIVQYVVGLRAEGEGRCVVDPMPFGLDGFEAKGLPMQGTLVDVIREGEQVRVLTGGREAARGKVGAPIEVRL
jgi:hypothetical protein